jgi:hypothetical protein
MKTVLPALTAAALVIAAGPAFAGKSTPQEREATRQLNIEAAQQAKNTNQQLAAATPVAQTQAPQTQSAPIAAPTTPVESAPPAQDASPAASPEPGANPAPAQ